MSSDKYFSILTPTEFVYKDKGSKFIALAYPIQHEEDVKPIILQLKKQHPGAGHFCYAYRLGANGTLYRSSDDGEPSGTAGKPILNQLLSFQLSDVLVVVLRYFGGTKLGVPGLIKAYKEAAKGALECAEPLAVFVRNVYYLDFPYSEQTQVELTIKKFEALIVEKKFTDKCFLKIAVPVSVSEDFYTQFQHHDVVNINLKKHD